MQFDVRLITPEDARVLLLQNTRNRPLVESHVAFFEEQLRKNEMQLTHQGIAISSNNVLLDGQHRLTAIARTGISATLLVATGLPDEAFKVLDTGSRRSAKDVLAMEGAHNNSALAAGIKLYGLYCDYPNKIWTGIFKGSVVTHTAILDSFKKDVAGWSFAASLASAFAAPRVLVPGPMTCLMYMAYKESYYSAACLERFAQQLRDGINLSFGDPVLAYRNKVLNSGTKGQSAQQRLADYIKLFNAFATGQKLKIFKEQLIPPMPTIVHSSESIHDDAAQ